MQALFEQFYSNGALLVLWGGLLFHLILPIPLSAHPTRLWRGFAKVLADKVNTSGSYSQRALSGTLAWLLMIIPALAILIALSMLVWQPQLFELALLLLAIDWRNSDKLANILISSMASEDKKRARSELGFRLNRDTSSLSQLGIGKAGAEALILGYGRNTVSVLFWFGLTGGIGAFLYRLIQELARAWSPSLPSQHPFGLAAVKILAILDFFPLRIFSLFIALGKNMSYTLKQIFAQGKLWPTPGPGWLLASIGSKLELSLGGPAIYAGQKKVRPKLGGKIAPAAIHLSQIQKLLLSRLIIWITLQSLAMFLVNQGV